MDKNYHHQQEKQEHITYMYMQKINLEMKEYQKVVQ